MIEKLNQEALEPCPFCGSINIDPEGWASLEQKGPACDDCGGSADTIELWNRRPLVSASLAERTRERDEALARLAAKIREVADLQQDPMWRLKEGMRERAEAAEARVKALTGALKAAEEYMAFRTTSCSEPYPLAQIRAALASSDDAPESKEGE